VSVIALFIGATIIIQTGIMAPATTGEMLGKILVAVVVRELAPLATAIVVAGRSGTAIATELGNMKVNSEVLALASLGVDPMRYVVLPRLIGTVVSVLALMVYFSVVAIAGGYWVSLLLISPSFDALRAGFAEALLPADLALYLIKGVGLGTLVGWVCCHYGLQVQTSPTEVPQKASRAVVYSLLGCVVFNTAVTAAFYWAVGSPVPG
jgi:phospholipid/cholesterol/gamma-HCH transport system permease protein